MNTQDIHSSSPRKTLEDPTSDMGKSKATAFASSNNSLTLTSAVVEVVSKRRWKNLLHCDDDVDVDKTNDGFASVGSSVKTVDRELKDQDGLENDLCLFPALQRAGSFPICNLSTPPRRPRRSGSFESIDIAPSSRRAKFLSTEVPSAEEDSEDEIDHKKFRRLLLGRGLSSSSRDNDCDGNASDDSRPMSDVLLTSLRYQKSASSAPPKIPNRIGSDSEDATNRKDDVSRIRRLTMPCDGQKSLPAVVFRPRPVRIRRRSRIQDMIDSETGSSLTTPPRLPNRTGSDRSNTSAVGQGDNVPGVLMLCPSTPGSKSSTTDAPRRPRRSLSPLCSSTIHSLFNSATMMDDADSLELAGNIDSADQEPVVDNLPSDDDSGPKDSIPTSHTTKVAKRRSLRKLPMRAKTFSFHTKETHAEGKARVLPTLMPPKNTSCTSLLSMGELKTDRGPVKSLVDPTPPSIADLNASMESIMSSRTWPPSRRARVALGRSRTFSFYQNGPLITSRS